MGKPAGTLKDRLSDGKVWLSERRADVKLAIYGLHPPRAPTMRGSERGTPQYFLPVWRRRFSLAMPLVLLACRALRNIPFVRCHLYEEQSGTASTEALHTAARRGECWVTNWAAASLRP